MSKHVVSLVAMAVAIWSVAVMAVPVAYFSDPTQIEVLNRWDITTGQPMHTVTETGGYQGSAQYFVGRRPPPVAKPLGVRPPLDYPTPRDLFFQIDLAPGTPAIGDIQFAMANADHAGDTFDISDQNGVYADETDTGVTWANSYAGAGNLHYTGATLNLASPQNSDYLRIDTTIVKEDVAGAVGGTTRYAHHMSWLTAHAAAGEKVEIGGSGYSIFYDSAISAYARSKAQTSSSRVTTAMVDNWFDGDLGTQAKQPTVNFPLEPVTDWITVPFESKWEFVGGAAVLYDTRRVWQDIRVEVSLDNADWTEVFYAAEWQMDGSADAGYMDFAAGDGANGGVLGQYVRFSWTTPSRGVSGYDPTQYENVELRDLQLFVFQIPEPASITVLGMALIGLLRRRRADAR